MKCKICGEPAQGQDCQACEKETQKRTELKLSEKGKRLILAGGGVR